MQNSSTIDFWLGPFKRFFLSSLKLFLCFFLLCIFYFAAKIRKTCYREKLTEPLKSIYWLRTPVLNSPWLNHWEGVYTWNFILGWNHPCLWLSYVSDCLHVFAEVKFHPEMKDRNEISSPDEKKKKRRVNTSSWDEILKWACF